MEWSVAPWMLKRHSAQFSKTTSAITKIMDTCTKYYSRIFLGKWAVPLLLFLSLAVLLFLLLQVEALEIKLEKHCCHVCFVRCRVVGRSVEPRNLISQSLSSHTAQPKVVNNRSCPLTHASVAVTVRLVESWLKLAEKTRFWLNCCERKTLFRLKNQAEQAGYGVSQTGPLSMRPWPDQTPWSIHVNPVDAGVKSSDS